MNEAILQAFDEVLKANMFLQSMGMTVATSLFLGAGIYNGNMKSMTKGIIVVAIFVWLSITTTIERQLPLYSSHSSHANLYKGMITTAILGVFYMLGVYLGSLITQLARKSNERKRRRTRTI